jgi:hypothetical protein
MSLLPFGVTTKSPFDGSIELAEVRHTVIGLCSIAEAAASQPDPFEG